MTHASFEAATTAWLADLRARGASPRTIECYRYAVAGVARAAGPLLDPPEAVGPRLAAWRAGLQQAFERQAVSASKVRLEIAALRSFYAYQTAAGAYPANPAADLRKAPRRRALPRPLEPGAVDALFAAVDGTTAEGRRDRCLLWLYYHAGRNSEVAHLTTANVLLAEREEALALAFHGKGDKPAVTPLVPAASAALAAYLLEALLPAEEAAAWRADAAARVRQREPEAEPARVAYLADLACVDQLVTRRYAEAPVPLFRTATGRPLTRRASNRVFAKYRERAGLPAVLRGVRVGPHALRHTCATELLEAGEDIRVVQTVLRHASIRQTEVYAEVARSVKSRALGRLRVPAGA